MERKEVIALVHGSVINNTSAGSSNQLVLLGLSPYTQSLALGVFRGRLSGLSMPGSVRVLALRSNAKSWRIALSQP